ncbi:hypothetical protein K503DRAFT_661822, partial [Rhizopogon vinicolor AM-OR11-026]
IKFAMLPLPDSYLFHEALAGSDLVDESDLPHWDKAPPYDLPIPPNTVEEVQFTQNLLYVMHGQQLRLERE